MGRGVHTIGDAASRRGLSRVGYFITLNGPLNGPRLVFIIITCSILIKNHLQLEKSTLQVVTEVDF